MIIDVFRQLLGDEGQKILSELRHSDLSEENMLRYITDLRKRYPRELVDAAVDTTLLRKKAIAKFSRADDMFFTREALEQASGEIISRYRSERYLPYSRTADLGCGIGGDTIPLAANSRVIAVDKDPLRLAMAAENARVYGVDGDVEFREADIELMDLPDIEAIFFDPARRIGGKRVPSVKDYSPPLDIIDKWLEKVPAIGVKISPAVKYQEIRWDCEMEFISVRGELKEAVLWFGPLKTAVRQATVLPSRDTLTGGDRYISIPVREPGKFLYEPDSAIIRSQLVETLAQDIGAGKIDHDIAYLTSDESVDTPFARRFKICEVMPFGIKKLNERLRQLDVGRVIVKKRGSPIEPQELQKKLKLTGTREMIVVLTHLAGHPGIILCTEDL